MRKTTPVEEFNIKEIIKKLEKKQDAIVFEVFEEKRRNIIRKINNLSLYKIFNNTEEGCNRPYLIDFEFIMDRLQKDLEIDQDYESIKVKLDITEQLEKMKKLPSFKTSCYIESRDVFKSTSIINFIRKFIFRHKKYRIVFHNKEAKFDEQYYKVNNLPFILILCCILATLIFSIIHTEFYLICASIISLICIVVIWFICL